MSATTIQRLAQVVQAQGALISEEICLPGRDPSVAPLPTALPVGLQAAILRQFPSGLYEHQSKGIRLGLAGTNVCMATATASGKTLVFASIVLTKLMSTAGATALVVYPAKALVSDQAKKWTALAEACDLDVAVIDGSVEVKDRPDRLDTADVVLMTPDVMHAWLLGRSDQPGNAVFLKNLRFLVLDEAHVYEGVFGTNMAYLMRRLRAASAVRQCIASTATISDPGRFLKLLTGMEFQVVGSDQDGSRTYPKTFVHVPVPARRLQPVVRDLVLDLSTITEKGNKFIAFVDSRKAVEELVAQAHHSAAKASEGDSAEGEAAEDDPPVAVADLRVLPYRAGYEEVDRAAIQASLSSGSLAGVISTSALELGIDIGDISTVILAGIPSSIKGFWQRAGRAGRSGPGVVIILDGMQAVPAGRLQQLLDRAPEENWIYPDNEYLQYANALCAADEALANPKYLEAPFEDLPPGFLAMFRNERNPTHALSPDLYALKQQANTTKPHFAFPVRTGIEKQYKVHSMMLAMPLGTLGFSQVLHEAYPGAIYRYMARAFRVTELNHGKGEIRTKPVRGIGRTTARSQAMAFPLFPNGVLAIAKSDMAFLMECNMQVNERVTGFVEMWGQKKTEHKYEIGSPYAQKPLARYFDTSGIVLHFQGMEYSKDNCSRYLARAFCRVCGVQEREIGHGLFNAKSSPLGDESVTGMAIYDSVQGSLRLTRKFLLNVDAIFEEAIQLAASDDATAVSGALMQMRSIAAQCDAIASGQPTPTVASVMDDWLEVIADGAAGVFHDGGAHVSEEVTVQKFVYTPQGPVYFLVPPKPGVSWKVQASLVKPIPGQSQTYKYNLQTGEMIPVQ